MAFFILFKAHLKARLDEIGTLPAILATTQRDLEIERSKRIGLEEERDSFLNEINSMVCVCR